MPPRIVAMVFSFLLLAMQQEAQWHALMHFGEWMQRPHEQALQLPDDDGPCAICALFAGGASAAPNDSATPPVQVADFTSIQRDSSPWTVDAPSFYLSRAPPLLL